MIVDEIPDDSERLPRFDEIGVPKLHQSDLGLFQVAGTGGLDARRDQNAIDLANNRADHRPLIQLALIALSRCPFLRAAIVARASLPRM
jgi:hypothetical protein